MQNKLINNIEELPIEIQNNWYRISRYQSLSEEFIEKYEDKVNWNYISIYQSLSEEFIEKYKGRVNWHAISCSQSLSEEFIEKYADRIDIELYRKHIEALPMKNV